MIAPSIVQGMPRWGKSLLLTALSAVLLFLPYLHVTAAPEFRLEKLAVLSIGLAMALRYASRAIYALMYAFIGLLSTIYLHIGHYWGEDQYLVRISVATVSPLREQSEYLRSYLSTYDVFVGVYFLLCMVAMVMAIRFSFGNKRHTIPAALIIGLALSILLFTNNRVQSLPFVAIPREIVNGVNRSDVVSQRAMTLRTLAPLTQLCSESYDRVVIVLGESAVRDHMSLYGYPQHTTPFLDSLAPAAFAAIAAANQTRYAVPMMMTGASVSDFASFYRSPSIITNLKACGYKTYWLSNQAVRGMYDDLAASIGKEADVSQFLSMSYYGENMHYDQELVHAYTELNVPRDQKAAIVFHLMGSHFEYSHRFPKNFVAGDVKTLVGNYDRSIEYTDAVLKQLFGLFTGSRTLFIYVSDHGEVVGEHLHGHGYFPGYRNEFRAPLVMWSTSPEKIQQLVEYARGREINLESFDHALLFLIGAESSLGNISFERHVVAVSLTKAENYDALPEYAEATTAAAH